MNAEVRAKLFCASKEFYSPTTRERKECGTGFGLFTKIERLVAVGVPGGRYAGLVRDASANVETSVIRFNHMEITVPHGFVARDGEALTVFMNETFGFERSEFPGLDVPSVVVKTDADASQFLFIVEHGQPMPAVGDDHLGFHLDEVAQVEAILDRCRAWQARDPRVEIRDLGVLDLATTSTRAFYVRYLLPIWFDVQNIAHKPGFAPRKAWRFLPDIGEE